MKTIQIILAIMFLVTMAAPVARAEISAGWSPVHEQRKANYDKRKKVYGPKLPFKQEETPQSDKVAAADNATPTDKAQALQGNQENAVITATPVAAQNYDKPKANTLYNTKRVVPAGTPVPPPSKALLEMKKKRAKKSVAPRPRAVQDVAGTVVPVAPGSRK